MKIKLLFFDLKESDEGKINKFPHTIWINRFVDHFNLELLLEKFRKVLIEYRNIRMFPDHD